MNDKCVTHDDFDTIDISKSKNRSRSSFLFFSSFEQFNLEISKYSICSHQSRVNHQKPLEYLTDHQSFIETKNSTSTSPSSLSLLFQSPQLRTKPSETLLFSSRTDPISLKLYNENSFPILFKLKTTQPSSLLSQPARGFIPAHSFLQCHLTAIDTNIQLILVIQYAQIVNEYDDYQTQWNQLTSQQIFLKKCPCLFSNSSSFSLLKPMLFTLVTMTLLTSWIIFRK